MPASSKCYKCGYENAKQAFCGACGSPLDLSDYISATVRDQISSSIRDRNVLETESSINVFQKALSWMKLMFGIAAGVLVLAGGGVFWKVSDFGSTVNLAKQSVTDTAKKSGEDITGISSQFRHDIGSALTDGKNAIRKASDDAIHQF